MKFRFVLLDPDESPGGQLPSRNGAAAIPKSSSGALPYEQKGMEIVRREQLANGRVKFTAVANFSARIVSDIILDDGEQQKRHFGVEAEVAGRRLVLTMPAAEFGRMGWVLNQLGPQAILYPGQQQHARAAIQMLSGEIRQERIFAHLGWRQQGTHWVYLHAAGALGAAGPYADLQVQLPAALQQYRLPPPRDPGGQVGAVRASLGFLSTAPDRISLPLLAGVYRAALGGVNFSLFLSGPSGVCKTALAALCQQHFGAAMEASRLPANFASTANALEWLAFAAKDALLVVDDFAPTGGHRDGELHRVAERLLRAAGNQQGRSRLGGDGWLRAGRPPRALVLATGEEVPPGQSIRARMLVVEVGAGEVDKGMLSACQRAGQEGLLAASLGAFVGWIAGQYEDVQRQLQRGVLATRSRGQRGTTHARTPAAAAELQSGWEIFLQYALEVGAIGVAEKAELEGRGRRALGELAAFQAKYQVCDPAWRFVGLLQAALSGGRAHVADRRGRAPAEAGRWGWQRTASGRGWTPRGSRIGWVQGSELYLEPAASYQVAQELAGNERLLGSEQSLRHRLRERGLLASVDAGREMLQVRRTLAGGSRQVLHLKTSVLLGTEAGGSSPPKVEQ
jgi:hypothetical protein